MLDSLYFACLCVYLIWVLLFLTNFVMYANLGIMGFFVTSILFEISLSLNMGFD